MSGQELVRGQAVLAVVDEGVGEVVEAEGVRVLEPKDVGDAPQASFPGQDWRGQFTGFVYEPSDGCLVAYLHAFNQRTGEGLWSKLKVSLPAYLSVPTSKESEKLLMATMEHGARELWAQIVRMETAVTRAGEQG